MRFLVDQNRPVEVAEALRASGHDAIHTFERGLERASDAELFVLAAVEDRVIISADTDFSAILAERNVPKGPRQVSSRVVVWVCGGDA